MERDKYRARIAQLENDVVLTRERMATEAHTSQSILSQSLESRVQTAVVQQRDAESVADKLRALNVALRDRVDELEHYAGQLQRQLEASQASERKAHKRATELEGRLVAKEGELEQVYVGAADAAAADNATIRILQDKLSTDVSRQRDTVSSLRLDLESSRQKLALMTEKVCGRVSFSQTTRHRGW